MQKQQEEASRLRSLIAELQGELEFKMPQLEAVRDAERSLGSSIEVARKVRGNMGEDGGMVGNGGK